MTKRIEILIEYLQGTCKSFSEGCIECGINEDNLTIEELGDFDSELFCCADCDWWYESCEESDDGICYNCADE